MSKKVASILLGCLLVFLLQSCRPKGILSREEMGQVLFDMHLTEALLKPANNELIDRWSNGLDRESFVDLTYRAVLKKHGLTPDQFDMNIRWYSRHLNRFDKVYKDVVGKLSEYKMQTQKRLDFLNNSTNSPEFSGLANSLWQVNPGHLKPFFSPECQYVIDSVQKYNQLWFGFHNEKIKPAFNVVPNAIVNAFEQISDSIAKNADLIQEVVVDEKKVLEESNKEKGPHFIAFKPESRANRVNKKTNEDPKISERFKQRVEAAKKQKESNSK